MRLFTKLQVSHSNAMRLAADVWVIFPDGVGRAWYLVDLKGARQILSADSVYRYFSLVYLLPFIGLNIAGYFDPEWELATGTLWSTFTVLALHLICRRFRTIVFDHACRRHLPRSVPSNALQLIQARLEIATFVGFTGVPNWIFLGMIAVLPLLFYIRPDWSHVFQLALFVMAFDASAAVEERPAGGWGREGLEELWQAPGGQARERGNIRTVGRP